jgi:hypothetical protein
MTGVPLTRDIAGPGAYTPMELSALAQTEFDTVTYTAAGWSGSDSGITIWDSMEHRPWS